MTNIEGNVLANTLANSAAEKAYMETQTTRDGLPVSTIEDAKAFSELANKSVDPVIASQQVIPAQTDTTTNPGDEILKSMQKISDSHTSSVNNLAKLSDYIKNSEDLTMAGAMEMQKTLMEFQLKQELISKSTGSINQGIQTLFKNQ